LSADQERYVSAVAASEPAPRRSQAERRAASEEALLRAAAELIAERGIERATLARIGERSGASRALSTYHFGSKDALVARLASHAQDRMGEATLAALEAAGRGAAAATALDRLRAMVDTYLDRFEDPTPEDRALLVMWGATFPTDASVDGMVEADRRSYDGWSQLVRDGQAEGSIRADLDPGATAVMLLGFMRGIAALLCTDAAVTDMRGVRRTCDAVITSALTPPGAA
jgi:AcrR family transcriptional regulator